MQARRQKALCAPVNLRKKSCMTPPVLIVHARGSNRDHDAALALKEAGAAPKIMTLKALVQNPKTLSDYKFLVLPGGFSFGDDLGAGKLFALVLRHQLRDALERFIEAEKPILGICNGFQTLLQDDQNAATLIDNQSARFECRWTTLVTDASSPCVFTENIKEVYCPVAHAEGRVQVRDSKTLDLLKEQGQIALRYSASAYPQNPNGSDDNIAALCNAKGNVMGLMPHPENHIYLEQSPRFSKGQKTSRGLGLQIFRAGLAYASQC